MTDSWDWNETAKLNGFGPQAWLSDVLSRISRSQDQPH
ncbi:MAG: transposase domain-containing protein [Rhizobiaceae bacterium]|nr:transposase domain-containing protein [Rhizobiaceae bacterium]